MKIFKVILFCICFLVTSSLYSQKNYYISDFPDNKIGTYMPIILINELNRSNSFRDAMLINNKRYYDVICINKNIVYSNLSFNDQYAIEANIVEKFTFYENNGIIELTDQNGFSYMKISEKINYYMAYRKYLTNYYFSKININQNILLNENGFMHNEEQWIVNLSIRNYPEKINIMFFKEDRSGKSIGIQYRENELEFYELVKDDIFLWVYKIQRLLFILK